MATFRFGDHLLSHNQDGFQAALAEAYRAKLKPECMCREPHPLMYVCHYGDQYLIKRMPYSGVSHAPDCDSFESPAELSGRGNLDGTAIQREEDGITSLKFEFSLAKNGKIAQRGAPSEKTSVANHGNRMSLRAFLHYLWDEAELTRWKPVFEGKRSWFVLRRRLLEVVEDKETKKTPLSSLVYIPEGYDERRAADIKQRRTARLANIAGANGRRLMLLVGEFDRIEDGRSDSVKLFIKHLPDYPFRMNAKLRSEFERMFEKVIGLLEIVDDSHLMVIATFSLDVAHVPEIAEISVMLTNENWIPIENLYERELVDSLTEQKRSFIKQLRFNLKKGDPIANAVLTDSAPDPSALFIVLGELDKEGPTREAMELTIANVVFPAWQWDPAAGVMPPFPAKGLQKTSENTPKSILPAQQVHEADATVGQSAVKTAGIPALV